MVQGKVLDGWAVLAKSCCITQSITHTLRAEQYQNEIQNKHGRFGTGNTRPVVEEKSAHKIKEGVWWM